VTWEQLHLRTARQACSPCVNAFCSRDFHIASRPVAPAGSKLAASEFTIGSRKFTAYLNRHGPAGHQYGRGQLEHRPGPIALNNIGQESCEGQMAFFFLLHTPGPADLELRGKVGRTQTGSFWRLPIGRRAVRVRRSGGVVRERCLGRWIAALASAITFFVCQLVLASFLLTATALNAAAQEAPKIEQAKDKPGQLKLPDDLMVDTGKAGKKLRPPACDKCKDEWDALRAALAAYCGAIRRGIPEFEQRSELQGPRKSRQ
jgi:hypothetical protein